MINQGAINSTCPKCGGMFESGELAERNQIYSHAVKWAKQAGSLLGIGAKGTRNLIANRCTSCGFIELYSKQN
jgi:predicted nucleic-acid-binding Zn-ribbon protein